MRIASFMLLDLVINLYTLIPLALVGVAQRFFAQALKPFMWAPLGGAGLLGLRPQMDLFDQKQISFLVLATAKKPASTARDAF
jgi:hypothetical protein